jgi:hypothetical protein
MWLARADQKQESYRVEGNMNSWERCVVGIAWWWKPAAEVMRWVWGSRGRVRGSFQT